MAGNSSAEVSPSCSLLGAWSCLPQRVGVTYMEKYDPTVKESGTYVFYLALAVLFESSESQMNTMNCHKIPLG